MLSADVYAQRDFEKEERIGHRMSEKIEKQYQVIEDQNNLDKLIKIGVHLKTVSGVKDIDYQFKIIDKKGSNAFALPGGFIYLTNDLLDFVQSDDELAAVIAHEMGHIIHQHSIKQILDHKKLKLVEFFTLILTGDPTLGLLGELASITILNSYRREYEREADLASLELLNKSQIYHPVALLTYFERVYSEYMLKPSRDMGIFQTHPDLEERIQRIKQYLHDNGIGIDRRLTTNYLEINGEIQELEANLVAKLFLNDEEILSFTHHESQLLYDKMMEIKSNLERSLTVDLEPYEMTLSNFEGEAILRIRGERVITLDHEEIFFMGLTADEVLQQTKEKITRILWKIKLELPALLIQ